MHPRTKEGAKRTNVDIIRVDGAKKNGPNIGSRASIQIEIYDGPHPYPYVTLPRAVALSNMRELERMGVLIVWPEGDKMFKRYVRGSTYAAFVLAKTPAPPGANALYTNITSFLAYLEGKAVVDSSGGHPAWMPDFGLPRVLQLSLGQFGQKISGLWRAPSTQPVSISVDREGAVQLMRDVGFQNIGGTWQQIDKDGLKGTWLDEGNRNGNDKRVYSARVKCDRCFILRQLYDHRCDKPCVRASPGSNECRDCQLRGIPTSWSPSEWIMQGLPPGTTATNRPTPQNLPAHQQKLISTLINLVDGSTKHLGEKRPSLMKVTELDLPDNEDDDGTLD
ncbi:unnamed protein product [Zymoseptoria tritici ST99CH_3D1]|nr:unnamed protein product [Zymoseptoria tritici ST99CH_3D1]